MYDKKQKQMVNATAAYFWVMDALGRFARHSRLSYRLDRATHASFVLSNLQRASLLLNGVRRLSRLPFIDSYTGPR